MTFLYPLMLMALAALPVLWWLMRLIPPRPTTVYFPPMRLLQEAASEETPAQMPWWLVLLRLVLAAAIITAFAMPVLSPTGIAEQRTSSTTLLILDDGWAAAPDWDTRISSANHAITMAESTRQNVAVLTINTPAGEALSSTTPAQAREKLRQLAPRAMMQPRQLHTEALRGFLRNHPDTTVLWLADGHESADAQAFAGLLKELALENTTVQVPQLTARGLVSARNSPAELTVKVLRAESGQLESLKLVAFDEQGRRIADTTATFASNSTAAEAQFALPVELRNEISRIAIASAPSAGGVQLLDNSSRRRVVGIVSGSTQEATHPLTAPGYYLSKALAPIAEIKTATSTAPSEAVEQLIKSGISVLFLADVATLSEPVREALIAWRNNGGVLVRFAGSRTVAAEQDDALNPVRLRQGDRTLGGALAWSTPQALAEFPEGSPFWGIKIPDDVRINRQVLAEPSPELAERTWASLTDGTPLVTARKDGKGLTVLFHVSAETVWSNLPLSGLFVDMLDHVNRLASVQVNSGAQTDTTTAQQILAPLKILDGFGILQTPAPSVRNLAAPQPEQASVDNPPGFYGTLENSVALNTLPQDARLARLDLTPFGLKVAHFTAIQPVSLMPWLLGMAFVLLLADTGVMLLFNGAFSRLRNPRQAIGFMLALALALTALPPSGHAQQPTPEQEHAAIEATRDTRLAYILTGDAELDALSRAGLEGLSMELAARTAFEPGTPVGLDPAKDELAFYALVYWPISANAPVPSAETMRKVDAFMKNGGSIIFDTRDNGANFSGASPESQTLRTLLSQLDVPELQVVPQQHVLSRTFYLLNAFPGRYEEGKLWIEAPPPSDDEEAQLTRSGDGVSPILITSNDLAGAWAILPNGQAMLPVEGNGFQRREMAMRTGINIVMYAFTGNYKADQVHVPALLERLGQ